MWKKILILSISFCLLLSASAFAVTPKQITNNKFKQTPKQNKEQIKYVKYALLHSVNMNYNALSVTLSYIPLYKINIKGHVFTLIVRNVSSNIKKPVFLLNVNSNAVDKAYYSYNKHTLIVTAVLRRAFRKNQITVVSEGHIIVVKFPTLKSRPVLSFPSAPKKTVSNSNYSVKSSKTVYVSLKNITMITTPFPITKIIYSKDQNIEISKSSNTAFVKILPLEEQKPNGRIRYLYNSHPRDIYIITPAGTYSLNLIPRHIPSVTVMLKNPQIPDGSLGVVAKKPVFTQPVLNTGINANVSYYRSSVYVNRLSNLIKDAYFFKIPSGFSSFALKKIYRFKQITIKGLNAWVGNGFIILIYRIYANVPVNLTEKEFLWMSPNPLAISIANPVLGQKEDTRLFIVEGANGQ